LLKTLDLLWSTFGSLQVFVWKDEVYLFSLPLCPQVKIAAASFSINSACYN
jgi:hypothetical protein